MISFLFTIYALLFILRTSFVIDGERYFALFDDAMISMRYAKNLAQGHGLVWNPGGEKLEGFTNPLWVLYMAVFHLFPIAVSKVSLWIQATGALFLVANLFVVRKIANSVFDDSTVVSTGAVFLTAFYLPLNCWSLMGMEVAPLTLLLSLAVWRSFHCLNKYSISPYVILGICTLLRMDMVVPYVVIWIFLIVNNPQQRRKNFRAGLLVLLACILSQTLFRLWYFGEWLPNTYYLKLTGYPFLPRVTRGLFVFFKLVLKMDPILFLLAGMTFFYKRDRRVVFMFLVLAGQILYSIYVGGDTWERRGGSNRYISAAMPLFFILFSYALLRTLHVLFESARVSESLKRRMRDIAPRYVFPVLLISSFVTFNCTYGPQALSELALVRVPLVGNDNESMVRQGLLIRTITRPEAKVAVVWAGSIPYFSDRYCIDILGKCDRRIARQESRTDHGLRKWVAFYPGHSKWDYRYSIVEQKPDLVMQLWSNQDEILPFIEQHYVHVQTSFADMRIRKDSPYILWDRVRDMQTR